MLQRMGMLPSSEEIVQLLSCWFATVFTEVVQLSSCLNISMISVLAVTMSVVITLAAGTSDCLASDPIATFSVAVDFGQDRGQNFGSLFEVRDSKDRVIAGAGFMEVYNTRFRSDRHTLQFFLRPEKDVDRFEIRFRD